jgi:hypothetical protein
MNQPKLKKSNDAQWRKYYEDKCRAQRKEIVAIKRLLQELIASSINFIHASQPIGDAGIPFWNARQREVIEAIKNVQNFHAPCASAPSKAQRAK